MARFNTLRPELLTRAIFMSQPSGRPTTKCSTMESRRYSSTVKADALAEDLIALGLTALKELATLPGRTPCPTAT